MDVATINGLSSAGADAAAAGLADGILGVAPGGGDLLGLVSGNPLGLISTGLGLAGLFGGKSNKVSVNQQVTQVQGFSYVGGDNPGGGFSQNPSTTQSTSTSQEDRTGVPATAGLMSANGTALLPTTAASLAASESSGYTVWVILGAAVLAAIIIFKKKG